MKEPDPLENSDLNRLQIFVSLIPVIGFFPALWTLYRRQGTKEQQTASRLSVTLAFAWLLGYIFLSVGEEYSDFFSLRLLIMNTMLTSGYFVVSLALMVRVWQRKSLRLAGITSVAEGIVRKHLS
jgi:uncharacterized membrane protein YqjE